VLLDTLMPNPNVFPTPMMTAALLSLRRYRVAELLDDEANRRGSLFRPTGGAKSYVGEPGRRKVLEFWERYIKNQGIKNAASVDAVEALRILRTMDRAAAGVHHIIASNTYLCRQALSCVERYLDNKMSKATQAGGVRIGPIREITEYFPPREAPPAPTAPKPELRKRRRDGDPWPEISRAAASAGARRMPSGLPGPLGPPRGNARLRASYAISGNKRLAPLGRRRQDRRRV
jgi:hypothetical protein